MSIRGIKPICRTNISMLRNHFGREVTIEWTDLEQTSDIESFTEDLVRNHLRLTENYSEVTIITERNLK